MGARIRSFDWANNPLGAIQTWPQSLRTVLDIMLRSQSPIFLWWGPELIQFYNDAYRPILGSTKHPQALGNQGRRTWSEIWDIISPMIESVMQRGQSTAVRNGLLVLERNGFPEEGYFDYAYSPIHDESGQIAGVFAACNETTEQVLSARRVETLRRLAASDSTSRSAIDLCVAAADTLAGNASDIPFALIYWSGPDGRPVFVAATGVDTSDPATAPELWPLVAALAMTINGAPIVLDDCASRVPVNSELAPLASGHPALRVAVWPFVRPGRATDEVANGVIVVGINPRLPYDNAYRTFHELLAGQIAAGAASAQSVAQARYRAEALAESEARYRTALLVGRMATWETDLVARTRQWSPEAGAIFGFAAHTRLGQVGGDSDEYWLALHPDDRHLVREFHAKADRLDSFTAEYRIIRPDGTLLWLWGRGQVVTRTAQGKAHRLVNIVIDVTERKVAEERVRLSEIRYRRLFEAAQDGVLLIDSNTRKITDANPFMTNLLSCSIEQLIGRELFEIGLLKDEKESQEMVRKLVLEHQVRYENLPMTGPNSAMHEVEVVATLYDEAGYSVIQCNIRDITRRKLAERALNLSEQRFRGTFENAAIGLAHIGLDGRWLRVNQTICRITGYSEAELLPLTYAEITHPDDLEADLMFVDRLLAGEIDNYSMVKRYLRKDGSIVWVNLTVSLLRELNGDPLHFISAVEDISAKRTAQEELDRQRKFIERLAHVMPSMLYVFDLVEQRNVWANRQVGEALGYSQSNIAEPGPDLLAKLMHPDDQEKVSQHFSRLSNSPDATVLEIDYRLRHRDGQWRWFQSHDVPFTRDQNQQVREIVGVAADVTRSRQVEQELREADAKKDHFIATLAHELRSPLAPIRNAINVMRKIGEDDPDLIWCRDIIDRQVGQMAHMLEDLLDVSRIAQGKLTLRVERVDLATVVEQAVDVARPFIDAAGHTLRVALPAQPLPLRGDLTRLAQVFSNLLINAAKYTEANGTIELIAQPLDDSVEVRVTDTGIGIDAQHLPQVFQMFGQVVAALDRSQGGLGIGLSLIKRLVEMHGGQISAHSAGLGKGSQFVVHLPIASTESPAEPNDVIDAVLPMPDHHYRVLVVDDSRDSADSLAMLLELNGHRVQIAYDGLTAVTMAQRYRPHAVLMDLGMPGVNGYEACRRIRQQAWGQSMLLIAQTGWGQESDRKLTREAGFDHHLVKPIDASLLDQSLRSWLDANA